jgi:spermidine/putrescine transport system permease protein
MATKATKYRNLMLVLIVAPFFASYLLRTNAWKTILSGDSFIVTALNSLNLLPDGRILNTPIAVIAGLVYTFLPFMILPLYASLEKIDIRLIEASGDLYASPTQSFLKVIWPLSLPGVVSGTLLTFIPASGDYINAELLGSINDKMIGNVIQSQFIDLRDYPTASALSFTFMAVILVLVYLYISRAGTDELV